ncbi:MAG: hypothetical protein B7Z55_12980 [Planctomycetales bacterium 12-60-4]|nr:MAG: hypothetical protein B7Z55_12980 [Planctomycetales bacterium 12-60-4]
MNLTSPSSNSIMVIAPYVDAGTWVFDDPSTGLVKEPFVAGIPEMIDVLVDGTGNYYRLDAPPMEGWICPALFRYYSAPPEHLYVKAEPITR